MPIDFRFLDVMLRAAEDPEVGRGGFAGGVRVGSGVRMPRLPALCRPKMKWRLTEQATPPPHSTHHTTPHHTHHTHAHTQRTTTTELDSTVKDRLGEDLRVSRGLDTVLKLTAESSCKEQTYKIPACNNHLTVGAVRCWVDFTLCLLKIFTERGYFLPSLLYERSPAV